MSANQPRRYQIPTHLGTPDKLDLPLFGITVSLTMRQGVCFLLGGSVVFQLWQASPDLAGLAGLLLHWVMPFLLAFATYVFAVHVIHGRHLEEWILVLLQYRCHPKVFVWCRVLEENAPGQTAEDDLREGTVLITTEMSDEEE